eukprot:605229-Hanusia_phi.AAC.1
MTCSSSLCCPFESLQDAHKLHQPFLAPAPTSPFSLPVEHSNSSRHSKAPRFTLLVALISLL